MVKKLNKKSFIMIMIGIAAGIINSILNVVLYDESDAREMYEGVFSADQIETMLEIVFGFMIVIMCISLLINAYFVYRLITNRKTEQKQGYITFLFVINIIGAVLNALSLMSGDPLVILALALNVLVIVGCVMQKKYTPPIEYDQNPVINVFDDTPKDDVFRDN